MKIIYKLKNFTSVLQNDTTSQDESDSLRMNSNEIFKPLKSFEKPFDHLGRSKYQEETIIFDQKHQFKFDIVDLKDFSDIEDEAFRFQIIKLDNALNKYFQKNRLFQDLADGYTLQILLEPLSFDSLQGCFIDGIEYSFLKDSQILFSDKFIQKFNCPQGFLRNKCDVVFIGKFIGKRVEKVLKK